MIESPPLLQVRRNFPRPTPEQVAAFAGVPTGYLCDCMEGRGAFDYRIKPLDPACTTFVGVAFTAQCGPGDNLALMAALAYARPGDVLVAATDNFMALALLGDRLAGMAKNRGCVAVITDGVARDRPGILPLSLPVLAMGITPNSATSAGPGTAGLPVVCGGVAVSPGDIVVGDSDGAVVVPRDRIAEVLRKLDRVRVVEADMDAKVAAGLDAPAMIAAMTAAGDLKVLD